MGTGDSFIGYNTFGGETYHSSPSSAEFKNAWSYTPLLHKYSWPGS